MWQPLINSTALSFGFEVFLMRQPLLCFLVLFQLSLIRLLNQFGVGKGDLADLGAQFGELFYNIVIDHCYYAGVH